MNTVVRDQLLQARSVFHKGSTQEGMRLECFYPHVGALGIALELTDETTEKHYRKVTGWQGFRSTRQSARRTYLSMVRSLTIPKFHELGGVSEPKDRWEQCYRVIDHALKTYGG